MHALETLIGTRVVASEAAITQCVAAMPETMTALRFATDELFLFGKGQIELTDEHALVEREVGLSFIRLTSKQFEQLVAPRIEWVVSPERPTFTQGRFLALPIKLWVTEDHALLICATAYVHELQERFR